MTRGWIGLGLLAVLLTVGLLVTGWMSSAHKDISRELEEAAAAAGEKNWTEAAESARDAYEDWQERWHLSAAFADHEPMEEIDGLFAQLWPYLNARDPVAFSALCRELARQVEAIGDAQGLNWWNFLCATKKPRVSAAVHSIFQKPSQSVFRPLQHLADAAFVHAPFLGDLNDGHFLEIIGREDLPLQGCQLLFDDPLHPFQLLLPGQTGAHIAFIKYIFHCASTPCRNSGP